MVPVNVGAVNVISGQISKETVVPQRTDQIPPDPAPRAFVDPPAVPPTTPEQGLDIYM